MTPKWDPLKIKEALDARGLTQEELAVLMGYSPATVSRTLNLHQPLNDKFAARVAMALGIPLHWLQEDKVAA